LILLLRTLQWKDVFSFCCVLLESIWSVVAASLLEGFLGITAAGVRLAFLEEQEAADENGYLLQELLTKTVPRRSSSINNFLLFSYRAPSDVRWMGF